MLYFTFKMNTWIILLQLGCLVFTATDGAKKYGKSMFVDKFNDLSLGKWRPEIRFSEYPDYEFNFYNKTEETVFIKDGILHLKPVLLTELGDTYALHSGVIDLNSYPPDPPLCTRPAGTESCSRAGQKGFRILPPVMSSRLLSTGSFKYGSVKVRAKMPLGDWIYPQIELTPVNGGKFGKSSGTIVIALTRGNYNLKLAGGDQRVDFGTKWLEGGLYPSTYNPMKTTTMYAKMNPEGWNTKFHDYEVEWSPDGLKWFVDGELVGKGKMAPPPRGFIPWAQTKLAPFDQPMKLAIGVGVGGIQRFPDGVLNNGRPKPWKNMSPKGMYDFWKAKKEWHPTWRGNHAALQIDEVQVWSSAVDNERISF